MYFYEYVIEFYLVIFVVKCFSNKIHDYFIWN